MNPIFAVAHIGAGVLAFAVSGVVGAYIAHQKGRSLFEGFIWGGCLGPIGWIIEALLPTKEIR